jgi:hypothetical protein
MELRHLRYFVGVVEAGSLTEAAAERLHTASRRSLRGLDSAPAGRTSAKAFQNQARWANP